MNNNPLLSKAASMLMFTIDGVTADAELSEDKVVLVLKKDEKRFDTIFPVSDPKERHDTLVMVLLLASDINHAEKNGIRHYHIPRNRAELRLYMDTRETRVNMLYRNNENREKILSEYKEVTTPSVLELNNQEAVRKKKKKKPAGGGSTQETQQVQQTQQQTMQFEQALTNAQNTVSSKVQTNTKTQTKNQTKGNDLTL